MANQILKIYPVKDLYKIEKKNFINISVFGYKNKKKYPIYTSTNCCEDKHDDLLLIEEKGKERGTMFLSEILTY